jgi:5-methylcytosine-specific restriction endonuclease McrA
MKSVANAEIAAVSEAATKVCNSCQTAKPLQEFHIRRASKDGRQGKCELCVKEHREALKKDPKTVAWWEQYYSANRDRLNKRALAKYYENKEKRFFLVRMRSLRCKNGSGLPVTHIDLARLWHRQKGKCALSGLRLNRDNSNLDHIIPVSKGGLAEIDNLRWLHKDVNHAKNDLSDAEFVGLCRAVVKHQQAVKAQQKEG